MANHKAAMKEEMESWMARYNEAAAACNANVETLTGVIDFLRMQCGVIYTAITGDPNPADPLVPISDIQLKTIRGMDDSLNDLNYMRNGIIRYVNTLLTTGNANTALQEWLSYIKE